MDIPDTLKARMELFKNTGRFVQKRNEIFVDSWLQVMIGQGLVPDVHHSLADELTEGELQSFLTQIESDIQTKVQQLPTHGEYLKSISR
ncbi:tryptophan 7-halogenase [Paraglaciecola aquimarina]|uniref:Tryptophan 7-halogenase n=1 Tax=Paraglaciecola aquimarina TaxID=1235557 RepID=A0ABU3SWH6_9ALTE|nr:tryptophan 7-halogenase [Paraglaciecola aquimarina]MDU0354354.1 tryptophan 7-halogenase [Paraglaciecola aquimarina]